MSIQWRYLDKRSATIAAIKDYDSMLFIIKNTDEEVASEREKMSAILSPVYDGMPHTHSQSAQEDRVINGIEEIDILKERFRQAIEYMDWFQPAWDQLTEDERYVLETFYSDANCYGSNAAHYIADHFQIEQSSAYRRKNRALDRLTVLLFGRQ